MWNVFVIDSFVDLESVAILLKMCPHQQPDVFSLDIDGIDFHIARRVLELGVRPKIWVVEYNSVFGPDRAVSVPYARGFNRWSSDPSGLYYGCSVNGWRRLFSGHGYTFVTVESSGCNAFFTRQPSPLASPVNCAGSFSAITTATSTAQPAPFVIRTGITCCLSEIGASSIHALGCCPWSRSNRRHGRPKLR